MYNFNYKIANNEYKYFKCIIYLFIFIVITKEKINLFIIKKSILKLNKTNVKFKMSYFYRYNNENTFIYY